MLEKTIIAILFASLFAAQADPVPNQMRLPNERMGDLVFFTPKLATFKTDKGKEAWEWMMLDFSEGIYLENTDRLRFEQREVLDKNTKITRTLLSIKINEYQWRSYLVDRPHKQLPKTTPHFFPADKRTTLTAYNTPARFLDDHTILVVPDHHLIAYRDYNHDGTNETFRAWRSTFTQGGRLLSEKEAFPNTEVKPTWNCSFSAWKKSYIFCDYKGSVLPEIPKPHPRPGFIFWGDSEYDLKDLGIENPYGHTNSSVYFIRYPLGTMKEDDHDE